MTSKATAAFMAELDRLQVRYNTVRPNGASATSPPDDEHHGSGQAIRVARRPGLTTAPASVTAANDEDHQ